MKGLCSRLHEKLQLSAGNSSDCERGKFCSRKKEKFFSHSKIKMENGEDNYGNEEEELEGATDSIDDEVDNEVNKFTKFCANHLTSTGMNHFQRHNEFWPELRNSWGDSLSRVTKGKELKGVTSSSSSSWPAPKLSMNRKSIYTSWVAHIANQLWSLEGRRPNECHFSNLHKIELFMTQTHDDYGLQLNCETTFMLGECFMYSKLRPICLWCELESSSKSNSQSYSWTVWSRSWSDFLTATLSRLRCDIIPRCFH